MAKNNYIKSPLNYLGNKYKLLPQMLELYPNNINTFYDLFCGGLDVSINVKANTIVANDKHKDLIWLLNEIKNYKGMLGDELLRLDKTVFPMNWNGGKALNTYIRNSYKEDKALRSFNNPNEREIWQKLMNEKREVFYKLRTKFNESQDKDFKTLLLLMLNTVGTIEFRVVDGYCTYTCGNNRVNPKLKNNLNIFPQKIKEIELSNNDFRYYYDIKYHENDFVYIDPPYLGTTQYKIKWNNEDELELYKFIDYLDSMGVKFALSNFEDGVNHTNAYLKENVGKYNIHKLTDNHSNLTGISKKGKRQEILVTNY